MPKPAKKQAARKPEPVVNAEIAAPAASASSSDLVRWGEFADGSAHIVKNGVAKCGRKTRLVTVVGTLPEGRRPPCEKCAAKI